MSLEVVEDENEEEWIPMVQDDQNHTQDAPSAQRLDETASRVAYSIPGTSKATASYNVESSQFNHNQASRLGSMRRQTKQSSEEDDSSARLLKIQNKLQDRISIQTHLVNRPLDYFWQRCLINLLRQMWTLEIRIQVGILMLATGLLMRVFLWFTWYLLYPRFAVLLSIFLASLIYLDPFDIKNQLKGTWNMLEALFSPSSLSQQGTVVEGIDTHKLRSLSLVLFMVPSILEVRTLSFLSRLNAGLILTNATGANGNGWTTVSLYCYNFGLAFCVLSAMLFLRRARRMKACDVSYRGLLILYGFSLALLMVTYEASVNNMRQIPALAAPFLTATATLLLVYKDDDYEWLSRITRQAFRLSLRDVLSMVSKKVTDDDMLQLAILRWICDFWASSSAPTESEQKAGKKGDSTVAHSTTSSQFGSTTEQDPLSSTYTNQSLGTSSETPAFRHNSIRWEELQPMLNIEIDHMETEIDALQMPTAHSSHSNGVNLQSNPTSSIDEVNEHPLMGLKSMLLSFDVDDRAQPAVLAFRRAVESFPPKKKTAVVVSILRRCPALLTVMLHMLFLSDFHSLIVTSLVLCPFVVMERYRLLEWLETCQHVESRSTTGIEREEEQNDWRIPAPLRNIDTMTILLSGDENTAFRPPSLLIVWFNVVSSVSALEVGLSTARCVETTAAAIEFAGSAMSLVKFGFEISQNGILHGVMVLAGEVLSIYGNGRDIANLNSSDDGTAQYTSAAVRTVHYGQKIARNVHKISEDENVLSFAQPLFNFLSIFTGGKEEEGGNDVSTFAGADRELQLNEVELQENKKEKVENTIDSLAIVDSGNKEDKLSTSNTMPEGGSTTGKPNDGSSRPPAQRTAVSKPSVPEEDLSHVMEMIATSYEQGLIDPNEKDDFFKKLSEFQAEELRDPSVLSAMKRTLTIILENGSMIPIIDDAGSSSVEQSQDSSLDPRNTDVVAASVPYIDSLKSSGIEGKGVIDDQEKESQVEQSIEQNNDIIALGVAALGVVASGVALTMRNDSKASDRKQNYTAIEDNANENVTVEEESIRERIDAVEIVEMTDHDTEDEWIALGD